MERWGAWLMYIQLVAKSTDLSSFLRSYVWQVHSNRRSHTVLPRRVHTAADTVPPPGFEEVGLDQCCSCTSMGTWTVYSGTLSCSQGCRSPCQSTVGFVSEYWCHRRWILSVPSVLKIAASWRDCHYHQTSCSVYTTTHHAMSSRRKIILGDFITFCPSTFIRNCYRTLKREEYYR